MSDPERIRALTEAKVAVELALCELRCRAERLAELLDADAIQGQSECPPPRDAPPKISER